MKKASERRRFAKQNAAVNKAEPAEPYFVLRPSFRLSSPSVFRPNLRPRKKRIKACFDARGGADGAVCAVTSFCAAKNVAAN